jgi:hypothetical protein
LSDLFPASNLLRICPGAPPAPRLTPDAPRRPASLLFCTYLSV